MEFLNRVAGVLTSLCVVLVCGAVSASAQTPPPAEAFLRDHTDVRISPDGRYISMIQPFEGRTALAIYPVGGGAPAVMEPGQRESGENLEVEDHFWVSPDRVVVEVEWNDHYRSRTRNFRREQRRLISMRPDGSDPQVLFTTLQDGRGDPSNQGRVISTLPDDPDHILVSLRERSASDWVRNVHRVNVNTGRSVVVAHGGSETRNWAVDNDGNVIIRVDLVNDVWQIFRSSGVEWRRIFSFDRFNDSGYRTIRPLVVLDGGRTLYVRSDHEGRDGIYSYDLENPGGFDRVYVPDQVDVGTFYFSWRRDKLLAVSVTEHLREWVFFDDEEEAQHTLVNRLLPGAYERVVSSTDDETMHIVYSYGPGEPPVYYLMNENDGSIAELAQSYPEIPLDQVGPISVVSYQARDGLPIEGYLVLPPGQTLADGPFPLVLNPHGGPQSRDYMTYSGMRQFLATRGYAVFEPNFRGSTGFGNEFARLGYQEWGGAMQDDLTDGVHHLIAEGIADPDRICIVGWSYSAYAALMGAVKTPDLYQCAAGINGVYDLPRLQGDLTTDRSYSSLRYWRATMGENMQELARVSPARRADEIQIPILILASEQDQTAPVEQTRIMVQALRSANRNFQSHIYEYGNHSLDYAPSRIDAYERLERFLETHLN